MEGLLWHTTGLKRFSTIGNMSALEINGTCPTPAVIGARQMNRNSALKVTENLDFDQIKENKLKSALLTTRGGAFRDIDKLDDAQKCALKAIEYQPQSHHPYTLMGAICYERGQYSQGDDWFNKAIKRGAESEDIDSELKRVVKNAKDEKRREVVEYLLKKDPQRYAWAKAYRKREER